MPELLAGSPDCDASDRVLTGTDLSELELTSKRRKTGEGSSENDGGLDGSRSNDDGRTAEAELSAQCESLFSVEPSSENEGGLDDEVYSLLQECFPSHVDSLLDDRRSHDVRRAGLFDSLPLCAAPWCQPICSPSHGESLFPFKPSSENEGGLDGSRRNEDGRTAEAELSSPTPDAVVALCQPISSPCQWELPFSVKPSSENEGRLDDSWSNDDGWMLDLVYSRLREYVASSSYVDSRLDDRWSNGDIWMTNKAGLLCLPPPHSLSLGTSDSQASIQNWNKSESNGSLDREDNHDNRASSENEDRLLGCRSYDDLPLKLTLPVSSTEIGKESKEINGVEGSSEVHPVAEKCPVGHPNAVQLLSASSSNSDCLDDISWMDGRPSRLALLMRDENLKPLHPFHVGTIFGNLKHENVSETDQLFSTQLSYIQKNNMDLSLAKSAPEAEDLFSHLLKKNLELRPEAGEVRLHPFFWNSEKKLRFLWRINDRLLLKDPAPDPDLREELESNKPPVFNGNWINKIDPKFKNYILQRGDNYDCSSVIELLRFVRNKHVHFLELPRKIKKLVGWTDESFYNYFAVRFPSLLMKSYRAASQFCREEKWFKEFHGNKISSGVLRK